MNNFIYHLKIDMRSVSRKLLTKEVLMEFTDAQLAEAKDALEKEIAKIKLNT